MAHLPQAHLSRQDGRKRHIQHGAPGIIAGGAWSKGRALGGTGVVKRGPALLTLLVVRHAKECIAELSDRMKSVAQSSPNDVTEYDLGGAGGFYMALSGDARMAKYLPSEPRLRQPSGAGVFREIGRLAAECYLARRAENVAGHLIVASGGEFRACTASIISGITGLTESDDAMQAEGGSGAAAICRNLALDASLSEMPCETAVKFLHSMASRIAKTVDSVGDGGKYGFDVVVFAKSGTTTELRRRTDRMGSIRARFKASDTGPLLGPNGGT